MDISSTNEHVFVDDQQMMFSGNVSERPTYSVPQSALLSQGIIEESAEPLSES